MTSIYKNVVAGWADLPTEIHGTIIMLYGLVKTATILAGVALPIEYRDEISKYPILNGFMTKDVTLAGKIVEYGLLSFAVFTLLRGMCELNLIHDAFAKFIMQESTAKYMYGIVGIILTIFYSIVVYTDLNIEKDPSNKYHYESVNLVQGLIFVAMLPAFYLFDVYMAGKLFRSSNIVVHVFIFIVLLSLVLTIGWLVWKNYIRNPINWSDITTMFMIPTSTI
jgi:hypothetical protein